MFWIIGADGAAKALAEMLSGKCMIPSTAGNIIDGQFEHAEWEGLRFYDLIFPLFIFVTGVAIVFSPKDLVADRCRCRDDRARSVLGAAVPDRQEHLDVLVRARVRRI